MLGIIFGVCSVIAMLAIGDGAKQLVLDRISAMGTNLLLVRPVAPNRRGAGGSVAFGDPENGIAFAYVMNQMEIGALPGERVLGLVRALYGG